MRAKTRTLSKELGGKSEIISMFTHLFRVMVL